MAWCISVIVASARQMGNGVVRYDLFGDPSLPPFRTNRPYGLLATAKDEPLRRQYVETINTCDKYVG